MRAPVRLIAGSLGALLALVWLGCSPSPEPLEPPAARAVELFELARTEPPAPDRMARLFHVPTDERGRARLYDALAALAVAGTPTVERCEPLEGLDRVVVDLSADLPGGATAEYSVQLEPDEAGDWKVVAFWGPGVSWPPRQEHEPGLSTWPEP